jgi:hypothetical protein
MRAARLAAGAVTVLLGAALTITVPSPASAAIYTVPSRVDPTGARNVTAALTSFINSVPDGSTVTFPDNARYRIEGTLRFAHRHDLTIDGNGATFFATTTGNRTRGQWSFAGGTNLTLRNMTVRGANPNAGTGESAYVESLEAQHAFNFEGVRGIDLSHVTATDVYGDFVYLGMYIGPNIWSSAVKIHDNTFARNGRQGITLTGAKNVEIWNNDITDTRRATFDFEPNGRGWGVTGVSIHDNTIGPGRLNFISAVGNGRVNRIEVRNNTLHGRAMNQTWQGARRHGLTIVGNVADTEFGNPGGAAIYVTGYTGVRISGNVQPIQPGRGMGGVDVWRSCQVDIRGNQFPNSVAESRIRDHACPFGSPTVLATVAKVARFGVQEPARKGVAVNLSGRLATATGAALPRHRVVIQFRPRGERTFSRISVVTTTTRGLFSLPSGAHVRHRTSGVWRAVAPASGRVAKAMSQPDRVELLPGP